jgi:hypothetical protein
MPGGIYPDNIYRLSLDILPEDRMKASHVFTVRVRRNTATEHQAQDVELSAVSVALDPDGSLTIKHKDGSQAFTATAWDRIEVARASDLAER